MTRRPWWFWALASLIGLAVLIGIIVVVLRLPSTLYRYVDEPKDRAAAEASTRTGMIAGLAGLAALGSLAITARTYRLTQQGQITERYTKAIEQLGSDKLDVRLGGIYALERIAKDPERDHPTVVEVLSAFVREHSDPAHSDSEPSIAKILSTFLQGDSEPTDKQRPDVRQTNIMPNPKTDVRAALTVLGRLPTRRDVVRADLLKAHLAGADLQGADLSGFGLAGANLERATLSEARLQDANLREANLKGANLQNAKLHGARLRRANLREANLQRAGLRSADLQWADLREANLEGANLQRADTEETHLQGVDLTKVQGLTWAQLEYAVLDSDTRLPLELQEPNGTNLRLSVILTIKKSAASLADPPSSRRCPVLRGEPIQGGGAHAGAAGYRDDDTRTRLPDGLRPPPSWGTGEDSAQDSS